MTTPTMTIAIPSYQRRGHLGRLLGSIAEAVAADRPDGLEVLVVLDGSVDGSSELVDELAITFPVPLRAQWQANGGLASARNAAIRAASGELVWLLDDDMVVTRAALERHRGHDRRTARVLMGPAEVESDDPDVHHATWWYGLRHEKLAAAGRVESARDCSFANTSAPAELLRRHAFDERFRGYGIEDYELAIRLMAEGETIAFAADAAVRHDYDCPRPQQLVKLREEGVNRVRFRDAHPDHAAVVFPPEPGRTERVAGRVATMAGPAASWALARGVDLLGRVVAVEALRGRLLQLADHLALQAGIATATAADATGRAARVRRVVGRAVSRMRTLRSAAVERARAASLYGRVRHLSGPRRIRRGPGDLLVITVVRNGELYLRSFLDHHRRLGVRHFLVLDNGSTDDTVPFLSRCGDVTLLQVRVPYATYENLMKRYLVRRYSRRAWNLFVDIDELFDYPGSGTMGLHGLIGYLEHHGYTAVVAQMLDMFADEPLSASTFRGDERLAEAQPWFDVSDISQEPYVFTDDAATPVRFHRGGIRRTVFGTSNGLTKAPLLFLDDRIETFVGWHHTRGARLADVTCVLRHHPFVSSFYDKVEEAARTGRYGALTSDEYRAYWAVLEHEPNLSLRRATARRFVDADQLVDLGLLVAPPRYRAWVSTRGHGPGGRP